MKIICAGLPKTGTKSLHEALAILGYQVYDFSENAFLLSDEWIKIMESGWTEQDFKTMYANVDAVCDLPPCFFWRELHQAFPDAKIILTTRNSEQEWLQSAMRQMEVLQNNYFLKIAALFSPTWRKVLQLQGSIGRAAFGVNIGGSEPLNTDLLRKKYREHNESVIKDVPAEKLLQYRCEKGWGPLCDFLGKPIPDQPFPHLNKCGDLIAQNMNKDPMLVQIKRELLTSTFGLVGFLGLGIFFMRTPFQHSSLTNFMLDFARGGVTGVYGVFKTLIAARS